MASYRSDLQTNRYQLSPYVERAFFKGALLSRMEFTYAHDAPNNIKNYLARMDLSMNLNKQGLSLRFYGNHDFGNKNAFNSLNLSIKKSFTTPLVGLRKYQNLKVVLFKDNNSDGLYNKTDEVIPQSNIKIGNQNFMTNEKGEAYYKNIKKGEYPVDLGAVNNVKGWVAKTGFKSVIEVSANKELYIPFQKSRFLSGNLNLVKDPFSKKEFNPANIRITAVGENGDVVSTLTNEEGVFFLNLAEQKYVIQVNTNVFNEDFRVLKETFNIDLTDKFDEKIVFEIRERKRQINIRR
jgi:hypothetical protein